MNLNLRRSRRRRLHDPRRVRTPRECTSMGFATASVPRRNLETNVENEETILNELKAARKELKKREDDPILLDKIKALKLRLEKVKQESDFRDEYKDDPCVGQCYFLRCDDLRLLTTDSISFVIV